MVVHPMCGGRTLFICHIVMRSKFPIPLLGKGSSAPVFPPAPFIPYESAQRPHYIIPSFTSHFQQWTMYSIFAGWKEVTPGVWRSVLAGRIWTLKQTNSELLYMALKASEASEDGKEGKLQRKKPKRETEGNLQSCHEDDNSSSLGYILKDYFQLGVSLSDLYQNWSAVDGNFADRGRAFPGVRVLQQEPVENLFSFICSSNNNISRISGMVDKLCTRYGRYLGTVEGERWFSFPEVSKLAGKNTERELRAMGFGYRAKYIHQTAEILSDRGEDWLYNLRKLPYPDAHSELQKLPGVGAKVADCVCLFSLDQPGAIPVDTHVWQIACRDYMPELRTKKSLTDKTYKDIGEFFRKLFGEYAGWAHSVLFSADLKKFKPMPGDPKNGAGDKGTKKRKRKLLEST